MNNSRARFSLASLAAAVLLLFSTVPSVLAQDQDNYQDPPTRAGRVAYTQGAVSFQPGGQGDWVDASTNRPLTTGDNLWADRDSRAEVQIGSTSLRLGSETSVTFLDLGNDITQLRLSMGSIYVRVRHVDNDDNFEIDTPNLAFNVYQPGEYRVDVNENGDSTIAMVWHGEAEITGGGNSYRLTAGQEGTFTGTDQLRYDVGEIAQEDAFDAWCRSRDERQDRIRSTQYVPAEMTGYEDLDEYGRWHQEGDYGYVWTPVGVPYGWAPYRYGHWVYISPWGWTWVDDEPWGFAPFHYGRWAFVGGGWCWVPGPVAVVPVYSPALVAFVGGGGFQVGVGVGVGWFPLAPGEVYVPWYRTSPRYVQNVNVTNTRVTNIQVTNVYNNVTVNHVTNVTYVNQRVNNGVTVVNRQTFVNAQPVAQHIVRVDQRTISSAPVTHEVVRNIQPERQSVIGAAHPVKAAPPQQVLARPVVATRQPTTVRREVAPVPGFNRPVTPPPVRTVRAVAPTQAQPLERGARGTTPGMENRPAGGPANAGRPMPENNRGSMPQPGAPRPGAAENNRGAVPQPGPPNRGAMESPRPGANVPRPGAAENHGNANQPVATPRGSNVERPNAPENPNVGHPMPAGNPNIGRPNAPENNHPTRDVPRPPSSRPEQQQGQPQQQPRSYPSEARPENNRPEITRPESPRTMPEQPPRPQPQVNENRPQAPDNRPATPQYGRPVTTPDTRTAPPENRPVTPETRAPQREQPSYRPEPRTEPAPRPEARPAGPPQHESRPQEQHSSQQSDHGKASDRNDHDTDRQKFR